MKQIQPTHINNSCQNNITKKSMLEGEKFKDWYGSN